MKVSSLFLHHSDGRSNVSLEFNVGRDINEAANDIRDRVSGLLDDLPPEAEPPDIRKVDSSDEVIMWLGIESDRMSSMDLTDYAKRYLQDGAYYRRSRTHPYWRRT